MFGEKHQSEMAVLVLDVCIILQVYFYLSYDRIFLKINMKFREFWLRRGSFLRGVRNL